MKLARLILLIILLSAWIFTACQGQNDNVVNLFTWAEYVPQSLLDNFTKQTGIKVNYDTYSSNEELMAKLQAGASGYDVIIPSDYTVAILINQKLLEPLEMSKIPNFANIAESSKNLAFDPGNQYSIPYQWGTTGLAINTEKVTRKITKWADLWDPAFKSELVMPDDYREVFGMALLTLGYDPNSIDPQELEQAKVKLLELKPNIKLYDSDSPKTAILSGEVWMGMMWNGEAFLAQQENPAIDYICPDEGCSRWYDNLAVPVGAPHKEAAFALINFILDPQNSVEITLEYPYSNPNGNALELLKGQEPDLYNSYMSSTATNPSPEVLKRTFLFQDLGEATSLWDRLWTEFKGE